MKKIAFHNLGCKVNSYELESIIENFQKHGYEIVDFSQKADIYIVNTCTVTNIADRKSRQMLHKAKALSPESIVVALGCYVQTDTEGAAKDEAIDLLIGNNEKGRTLEYVEKLLKLREDRVGEDIGTGNISAFYDTKTFEGRTIGDLTQKSEYENMSINKTEEHTRAFVKIQDGCDQFCSYCAIPLARGRVRSRSKEDTISEIKSLRDNGYREIVVTGIHLSSYGLTDAYNIFARGDAYNEALLELIAEIAQIDGIDRIRLGSLEPRLITREFMERLSKIDKVCPHFHLSLQSGSDTVLKRMNRQYSSGEFLDKAAIIREYYEHPAITTDIIAGFPAESEEEFLETVSFANKVNLYETHVFKYSRRKGTVADKMPGQHTDKVKSHRSSILMEDAAKRKDDFVRYYLGKTVELLTEDIELIGGNSYRVGYTPEYVKCAVSGDNPENVLVTGKGKSILEGGVLLLE